MSAGGVRHRPVLVAVDGIDGSGKSVFAERLARAFGARGLGTAVLRVDDFRRAVDWRLAGRSEADAYYDDYYDLGALGAAARALLEGAPSIAVPVFDVAAEHANARRTITLDGASAGAVVIEGVFVRRLDLVGAGACTAVYLRTSFAEAERRILARDTARGRTVEEVTRRIWNRYFPAQDRYLRAYDPVGRADVVIDHELLGAPALGHPDGSQTPLEVRAALDVALRDFAAPPPVK